jgi:hypothetical protein
MRASKTDWAVLFVANRENEAMRHTINESIRPKSGLAIVEPVVPDDCENIEINPARQRYAMLRKIDGFLGRIEVTVYTICWYSGQAWHGCHIVSPSRQHVFQPV